MVVAGVVELCCLRGIPAFIYPASLCVTSSERVGKSQHVQTGRRRQRHLVGDPRTEELWSVKTVMYSGF